MNSLNLFLLLLSAVALAFVMIPLWRHRSSADNMLERRREKNRDVFRQREGELSEDLRQGLVTEEEHAKLLAELQRAFLLDMEALDKQGASKRVLAAGRPLVVVLALVVPLASLIMYRNLGSGPDLALPAILERVGAAQTEEEQLASYNELAAFLRERLDRRPDDVLNGYSLGTLYTQLERFAEAVDVLQRVEKEMEDGPDRATVLGALAQAQYLAADSKLTPDVQQTIDEALRLEPNQYAVMGLLAIDAALVRQDFPAALGYWRRQLSSATPGSAEAERVRQIIAQFETFAGGGETAEVSGPAITVNIGITPELAAQMTDDMVLFVFVRSPQPGGPPIVAKNLGAAELPVTVTLSNADAIMGRTLESLPELVVGARLTDSGQPVEQSGDFQTFSAPFAPSAEMAPLELVIDEVVP